MDAEPPARPVAGTPSGLTDAERSLLLYLAIRTVAAQTGGDMEAAADALDHFAADGRTLITWRPPRRLPGRRRPRHRPRRADLAAGHGPPGQPARQLARYRFPRSRAYSFPTISTCKVGKDGWQWPYSTSCASSGTAARAAADQVLERAAAEQRDLTGEELADYQAQVVAQREADDAIEAERDREVAELRAAATRRPGPAAPREPVLTREQSVTDWLQARGAFDAYQDGEPLSLTAVPAGHGDRPLGRRRPRTRTRRGDHRRRWRPGPDRRCRPGSSTWPATQPGSSRPAPSPSP